MLMTTHDFKKIVYKYYHFVNLSLKFSMYWLYVPKKCINQIVHMKVLEQVTNAHDSWFYVRSTPLGMTWFIQN